MGIRDTQMAVKNTHGELELSERVCIRERARDMPRRTRDATFGDRGIDLVHAPRVGLQCKWRTRCVRARVLQSDRLSKRL